MSLAAAIFDFNGTLCPDNHLHDRAWDLFLSHHGIYLTEEEKKRKIHGKNNRNILRAVGLGDREDSVLDAFGLEKESLYRALLVESGLNLTPGAIELFDFLQTSGVPFSIATSAGIENVRFYLDHFNLSRYFDISDIVYDDGIIPGKPDPALFHLAASRLGFPAERIAIFEDSPAGLEAARRFGAGRIFLVDVAGRSVSGPDYTLIRQFGDLDKSIFSQAWHR